MGADENKKIVRAFFDAGNRGDMNMSMSLIAPDVSWTNVGSHKYAGTFVGMDKVMGELLGPLFAELEGGITSEVLDLIAEGDKVVALTKGTAKTKAGKPYENRYCQVMTIRDGKIAAVVEYCDTDLVVRTFA